MAFQTWQVGLDIQNGQFCALAILRRRYGWQLRHWWQYALPHDTLSHGLVQRPEVLVAVLQRWRRLLPARISLRVGFPPQLAMQRRLSLPATELREPDRGRYIIAAAKRFFPVAPEDLALDYRSTGESDGALYLTATRREALQSWLDCLQQAALSPDVMELTPAALPALASVLNPGTDVTLVHRLNDHWLWYAPHCSEQVSGWCSLSDAGDLLTLQQRCFPQSGAIWYSSVLDNDLPAGVSALTPFAALRCYQPPLPVCQGAFTLAMGLALRPGDC